jgi:hypothetical protein
VLGEVADLLDRARSTLLEANTVQLKRKKNKSVFRPKCQTSEMLNCGLRGGLHKTNSFFCAPAGRDRIDASCGIPQRCAGQCAVSNVFRPSSRSNLHRQGESSSTYPLVQVDGVLAGHHVGEGRTGLLAGLDVAGHF